MGAAITVGASLSIDQSTAARALSKAWSEYLRTFRATAQDGGLTQETKTQEKTDVRCYKQAGVPTTNTSAESPGQNLCFIKDTTNNDLYLVHTWSAAGTFTAVKIMGQNG